jgi:hypothetical protein
VVGVSCTEVGFSSIDPETLPQTFVVVEDRLLQRGLPAVDVLFVVDDTRSMEVEQVALAAEFGGLIAALDRAGLAWQVGVVATSMDGARPGWLHGDPWVVSPGGADPAADFADAVAVGTSGEGEAGLAAAIEALALSADGGENAGFRRPDAALHVVFVSDGDDASDALHADPVAATLAVLQDEADRTGWPAMASAIVGPPPDGCVSENGQALAAERYHAVVDATGGATTSICAADFSGLHAKLADVEVTLSSRFPLSERPLDLESMTVGINGTPTQAWTVELQPPVLVFDTPPPADAVITISYLADNT